MIVPYSFIGKLSAKKPASPVAGIEDGDHRADILDRPAVEHQSPSAAAIAEVHARKTRFTVAGRELRSRKLHSVPAVPQLRFFPCKITLRRLGRNPGDLAVGNRPAGRIGSVEPECGSFDRRGIKRFVHADAERGSRGINRTFRSLHNFRRFTGGGCDRCGGGDYSRQFPDIHIGFSVSFRLFCAWRRMRRTPHPHSRLNRAEPRAGCREPSRPTDRQ